MKAVYLKSRSRGQTGRNKIEERFESDVLKMHMAAKEIQEYWYEPFSISLSGPTYKPDFMVHKADGEVVLYEIKALAKDGTPLITPDGKLKLEVVRGQYPFRVFIAAWNYEMGWHYFEVE